MSNAIAIIHREAIIEQLAIGKRLSDIAPALGVNPNAISKVLKSDPEYRGAIESGLRCRLDAAEAAIEGALEQVDVARARARFSSVAWRAERECPEEWGQRSQVDVRVGVTVDQALGDLLGRVIEGLPVVSDALPEPDGEAECE